MRLLSVLALFLLSSPAWSETQPDNAAILTAIQGLSTRLDGMQKQIDDLKQSPSGKPPAAAITTAKDRSIPGWQILVLNRQDDDPSVASGVLAGPLSDFNFGLHTKQFGGRNQFTYAGQAFFHARGDAAAAAERYVFLVTVDPVSHHHMPSNWQFNCAADFAIQDHELISGRTHLHQSLMARYDSSGESTQPQTYTGAVDLKPGDYAVSFRTSCWLDGEPPDTVLDEAFPVWQRNRFHIQVRTPDDSAPRAFTPDELFHIVRSKT